VQHAEHVALLRDGVPPGGVWADLGSGDGAFTLALADLLGAEGSIHSVDRDADSLRSQERAMSKRFPTANVTYLKADFTESPELPLLDGLVMANSLHFHEAHAAVVRRVARFLRPGGRFILVEYDADRGNPWVPHPLSYATWEKVAASAGLRETRLLAKVPSRFLGAIYSALSFTPEPTKGTARKG
jgi:ubiquinone/menaquinone biosynthesis C-methylase UbiE